MSQYEPPSPTRVLEESGLYRSVEYSNGAQAEQYFDVDAEEWLNECDEVGNLTTIGDQEDE